MVTKLLAAALLSTVAAPAFAEAGAAMPGVADASGQTSRASGAVFASTSNGGSFAGQGADAAIGQAPVRISLIRSLGADRASDVPASHAAPTAPAELPEPAMWAMMVAGFGLAGWTMRRAVRRSEARFDERIRQIASGEID